MNIRTVKFGEKNYPKSLNKLDKPPRVIYYMGDLDIVSDKTVAVIGKRNATEKQLLWARATGQILGGMGYAVVNGLALGCDQMAIEGALKVGGKVIAVMPGGLDRFYPSSAGKYVERILKTGGCILSEYPNAMCPRKSTFVERDRIQAALSEKVFVVAAEKDGGTMHTVKYALNLGKAVGCYIDDSSSGNRCIIEESKGMSVTDPGEIEEFMSEPKYQQLSLF